MNNLHCIEDSIDSDVDVRGSVLKKVVRALVYGGVERNIRRIRETGQTEDFNIINALFDKIHEFVVNNMPELLPFLSEEEGVKESLIGICYSDMGMDDDAVSSFENAISLGDSTASEFLNKLQVNSDRNNYDYAYKFRKEDEKKSTSIGKRLAFGVGGFVLIVAVIVAFSNNKNKKNQQSVSDEINEVVGNVVEDETIEEYAPEEYSADTIIVDEKPRKKKKKGKYILSFSSSRKVKERDLRGLSKTKCRLARNEIYARHGRRFDDKSLQKHFDSCSWYNGTIDPEDFNESALLNKIERRNASFILKYERKKWG